MEAAMPNWFRNWKTRREPEKKQEQPLACPNPKCGEWASRENLDRALTQVSDLRCEKCRVTNSKLDWAVAGLSKSQIKGLAGVSDAFTTTVDKWLKGLKGHN